MKNQRLISQDMAEEANVRHTERGAFRRHGRKRKLEVEVQCLNLEMAAARAILARVNTIITQVAAGEESTDSLRVASEWVDAAIEQITPKAAYTRKQDRSSKEEVLSL